MRLEHAGEYLIVRVWDLSINMLLMNSMLRSHCSLIVAKFLCVRLFVDQPCGFTWDGPGGVSTSRTLEDLPVVRMERIRRRGSPATSHGPHRRS